MISVELDVVDQIKKLSTQKAQYADLPVKILKENSDIFGNYICSFFNDCVKRGDFLSILKIPNITPVFKKVDRDLKDDYHPLNILPVISKIIWNLLCKRITMFIDLLLSRLQCGS